MDVGYASYDSGVVPSNSTAKPHGDLGFCSGLVRRSRPLPDHNFALLQEAADESHFQGRSSV